MSDAFLLQYQSDERLINLFRYFTLIAIILSLLGLFGLAAFMIKQRTKEIAIRKVFGASVLSIIQYLSARMLILILIANAVAWPIAYILSRNLLDTYVYKAGINLWIFPIIGLITLCLTLLVIGFHTLQAAARNPADTLKYE
jgi:putative ABC transport system permease protein